MYQYFLQFSGLLAMFFAWFVVVFPAIRSGINLKNQTITSATEDVFTAKVISAGLILGALFQGSFLFYLTQKLQMSLLNIGSLIFLSTNIATILVAFFTEQKYSRIHNTLVKYYFIANPVSLIFIGLSVMGTNPNIFIVSVLTAVFYFLGIWWLLKKFKDKNVLMEGWAFSMLSFWTIFMTIVK